MRVWTVHVPPTTDRMGRPSRRAPLLVREGFSWGALLFGPVWFLAHRLWLPAVLWLAAAAAALLLARLGGAVVLPAAHFLLACHARDLWRRLLARRGYAQAHVVAEHDRDRALARLLAARPDLASAWGRAALA
jgi:hypothetical protein